MLVQRLTTYVYMLLILADYQAAIGEYDEWTDVISGHAKLHKLRLGCRYYLSINDKRYSTIIVRPKHALTFLTIFQSMTKM